MRGLVTGFALFSTLSLALLPKLVFSQAIGIPFKNIGPEIFSGRVVDLEVNPSNSTQFLVAFATGGLWETKNNGRSFTELFVDQPSAILGDIAVDWNRGRIWVGTGENNSSRSSYAGNGVYVSDDWGKTWKFSGLAKSHHIGRIVLDPANPNNVLVASLGPLYSQVGERGIFRTSNGGETWQAVLPTSGETGAIDLIADPTQKGHFYASTWERDRKAWNFKEAGSGSAIYKSTDSGATWEKITSGFPSGKDVGRIGLSASKNGDKTVLYAVVDNQARRPELPEDKRILSTASLNEMSPAAFLALDKDSLLTFFKEAGFPVKKYPLDSLNKEISAGRLSPKTIAAYLTDANSLLFDTPVVGAEVYRSDDTGASWYKTHSDYLDDVYYSYGYYFGQIRVHPTRPEEVYIFGVPALRSIDGGKTWKGINENNVHADHHALWIDPNLDGHLILGNDGGINISYDAGQTYARIVSPPAGQFYAITVDNASPYRVYGGVQDNGVWRTPSTYTPNSGWEMTGKSEHKSLLGGDGMQVMVDPRDNETVYTGYQFGNYVRLDPDGSRTWIKPSHKLGERPLRFNWQTPIYLSKHNADVLYFGSNKFHRSLNKGEHFDLNSQDLTKGGKAGDVPFGTLTTIHESPLRFGKLFVGTDDGLVHTSSDGGYTWEKISSGLPDDKWVSRVQASSHSLDRVYVSLNGYRDDDFAPYLFVSETNGRQWKNIGTGLPQHPINDILEDSKNPALLYVATDGGLYFTMNAGQNWARLGDVPNVPIHDLEIQEREQELVVASHGKSIFIGKIDKLRQLQDSVKNATLYAFTPDKVNYDASWGKSWSKWNLPDTPLVELVVFSKNAGTLSMVVKDSLGQQVNKLDFQVVEGINYLNYALTIDDSAKQTAQPKIEPAKNGRLYLRPGRYAVELSQQSAFAKTYIEVVKPKS